MAQSLRKLPSVRVTEVDHPLTPNVTDVADTVKRLPVFFLVALLLAGCGKTTPTYRLVIGKKIVPLPVHDDPKLIQDDVIKNIRPLWDNLTTGDSPAFYCERVTPWNLGKPSSDELEEEGISATHTSGTAHWRFFKGRKGKPGEENGIDADTAPNQWQPSVRCNFSDWKGIEEVFRHDCLTIDIIRRCIQRKDEQPNKSEQR